jgi:hypothetical protein
MALNEEEKRVVEILYGDWPRLLRCTNIEQAMARAGMGFDHGSRLRIAEFVLADAHAKALMRWAPHTYVLTNSEKSIARQIMRRYQPGQPLSAPSAETPPLDAWLRRANVRTCDALRSVGFLRVEGGQYRLTDELERFREGLGLYFHEVELPERGERFNTNCVPDFFIMTHRPTRERAIKAMRSRGRDAPEAEGAVEGMSTKMMRAIRETRQGGNSALAIDRYEDEIAVLIDACGWTDEPVRVVMERGRLAEVKPESAWHLVGDG